jgi:high-affinity iron transporter
MGVAIGVLISLIIAGAFIGVFYKLGRNHWAPTEYFWEGSFALLASIIITIMGAALLRISKMQEKWRVKLAKAMEAKAVTGGSSGGRFKRWCEKYAMFILPLVTVLREGIEAVVFIAGVSFSASPTSIPLPVVMGTVAGSIIGYIIYK